MKDKIKDVLLGLDPENDELWTQDGKPRMEAVELGVQDTDITRKQVTDAWPEYNRDFARELKEEKSEESDVEVPEENSEEPADDSDDSVEETETEEPEADENEVLSFEEQQRLTAEKRNAANNAAKPAPAEPSVPKNYEVGDQFDDLDYEELLKAQKEQEAELNKLLGEKGKVEKKIAKVTANRNHIVELAYIRKPKDTQAETYKKYLASENKKRQRAAALAKQQQKVLEDAGLANTDPRAPIDKALNNKPDPSMKRPTGPGKVPEKKDKD